MSVSICVEAHRRISEADMEYVAIYNSLVSKGIKPPAAVVKHLQGALGNNNFFPDEKITISPDTEMIAISVGGAGDARHSGGMIIKIADLPPGTEALRIYMS